MAQLAYAAYFDPFHDIDIAFVIETRAVRTNKLTGLEVISRQFARRHVVAGRVVAQVLDDAIVAVHDSDARKKVGNHHVAILEDIEVARRVCSIEGIDGLAVKREALNSFVAAVGDIQDRRRAALVEDDSMRALELSCFLPGPPKVRMYSPLALYWMM